jgi:hypothetical protein
MPLTVLLLLVVLGIAGIGVLLHLGGASRRFDISDEPVARREWARHRPHDAVVAVHLAAGAALIETEQGLGLLRPFGADTVAHGVAEMRAVSGALRIGFADFAAPPVRLALDDAARARWLEIWRRVHA